tara:strand:- start:782 stop:1438 length:657 start_codon:yes stop_codon:yes gene_type:complete
MSERVVIDIGSKSPKDMGKYSTYMDKKTAETYYKVLINSNDAVGTFDGLKLANNQTNGDFAIQFPAIHKYYNCNKCRIRVLNAYINPDAAAGGIETPSFTLSCDVATPNSFCSAIHDNTQDMMGRLGVLTTIKNEGYKEDTAGATTEGVSGQNGFGWGDGVFCDNPFGKQVRFRVENYSVVGGVVSWGVETARWSDNRNVGKQTIIELGIQLLPEEYE